LSGSATDNRPADDKDYYATVYRQNNMYDPERHFTKLLDGTWAPYCMTRQFNNLTGIIGMRMPVDTAGFTPGAVNETNPADFVNLTQLPNVDIVITSDRSKWSRCVVVETSPSKSLGSGARPMAARWAISKNQDGQNEHAALTSENEQGMSWFPGYAINVDNGERLNIFFGEASWYAVQNGGDMLFNPTSDNGSDGLAAGGRHYVFVTNQKYDGCENIKRFLRVRNLDIGGAGTAKGILFRDFPTVGENTRLDSAYKFVAWAGIPMVSEKRFEFKNYSEIPCDVKISLRVNRSFANTLPSNVRPVFEFNMGKFATETGNIEVAKNALDLIHLVPNPYYGRSGIGKGRYEGSQIDTRMKITNLPAKCTIRIFTLNGSLVRTFKKDSDAIDQEWDLKNDEGVPIASGVYIFHIDAKELGQKVLKFFAVMPETDLNSY
ncbi:MAG: hypothetical protein NZ108_07370, partial [Bacteroidia bacterium]|nr:hypothetical protein [Bacteroidia bacterium]